MGLTVTLLSPWAQIIEFSVKQALWTGDTVSVRRFTFAGWWIDVSLQTFLSGVYVCRLTIRGVWIVSVRDLSYICLAKTIVLTFILSNCHSNDVYHPLSVCYGLDVVQCSMIFPQYFKKNRFCLFSKWEPQVSLREVLKVWRRFFRLRWGDILFGWLDFVLSLLFWDRVSPSTPGWTWTCDTVQAGLELIIFRSSSWMLEFREWVTMPNTLMGFRSPGNIWHMSILDMYLHAFVYSNK